MIEVYPSTYSPAALPSSVLAAPAKKRRLSAENGISSPAIAIGLPTFCDSSLVSSSAFSSITSPSFSSSSIRSFGVLSAHSSYALRAAATARSTSSVLDRGTSAITSPVEGLRTSIVSPDAASTQSPPTRFLCLFTDTLTGQPSARGMGASLARTRPRGQVRRRRSRRLWPLRPYGRGRFWPPRTLPFEAGWGIVRADHSGEGGTTMARTPLAGAVQDAVA